MNNKVRFIMPAHSLTYKYIKESGYEISCPYYGNKLFVRLFREVCFRLPFRRIKEIWFNKDNCGVENDIILYENLVIPEYVKWLKRNNKDRKIFLFYENLSNSMNRPDKISDELCEKWTADENEAKKYGMNWYTGGGYFKLWKVKKTTPQFDIFYIGRDKGRLDQLVNLKNDFENLGLSTYFHVTAPNRYAMSRKKYKPLLSYDRVLDLLGETRAILHLSNGCQKGVTFRIQESLIHEIKLITDDCSIKKYDFYDSNNIFILGEDDFSKLRDFVFTPYKRKESSFYENAFFDDFVRIITGKED